MRTFTGLVLLVAAASAAVAAPPRLREFRDHVERQMYWTAAEELKTLLGEHEEEAWAWALLAECRLAMEDPEGAETAAMKAVDFGEEDPDHWTLWGRACFEIGVAAYAEGLPGNTVKSWFADAEMKFRQVLKLDPDDPDVRWRLGWAKEWQEYTSAARSYYGEQMELFPQHPGGYRRLGQLIANKANQTEGGKTDTARRMRKEAFEVWNRGLKKGGDDAELLHMMGVAYEWEDAPERALDAYLRSIRVDPDYRNSWDRAVKLCDPAEVLYPLAVEVLRKHPKSATAAWWAGYYANRGAPGEGSEPWSRHEEALRFLLPALAEHGDHKGLYTQAFLAAQALLGRNPRQAPNAGLAEKAFQTIHEAYRWSADAANNLGLHYRDTKQYPQALEWYLKSAERAPENQDILNDTGLIYLFHVPGQREKGLPFFLKTVALVQEGDQKPERGYWDALENLCKHYWEVDRQPEKVLRFAAMRYEVTKGVKPYNMSQKAEGHAKLARKALGK